MAEVATPTPAQAAPTPAQAAAGGTGGTGGSAGTGGTGGTGGTEPGVVTATPEGEAFDPPSITVALSTDDATDTNLLYDGPISR